MNDYILQVKNLKTWFSLDTGTLKAVDDVTFLLKRNETIGIIGESGCGKSVTAHSILRTVQTPGKVLGGEILYDDGSGPVNLVDYAPDSKEMRKLRGKDISMIFQEPMASLSPVYTVGAQMMEAVMVHQEKKDKKAAKELCMEMLRAVGMPNPEQKFNTYPHQMSGGQCQRAMIALAMVNKPKILIADEPTTALDVTIQAQILDLLGQMREKFHMAVLLITHDLGVVSETADRVVVMYCGKVMETADVKDIFEKPLHPYTVGLLKSIPRLEDEDDGPLYMIQGMVPNPLKMPSGCPFSDRCEHCMDRCRAEMPELVEQDGRKVRCFLYSEGKEEA